MFKSAHLGSCTIREFYQIWYVALEKREIHLKYWNYFWKEDAFLPRKEAHKSWLVDLEVTHCKHLLGYLRVVNVPGRVSFLALYLTVGSTSTQFMLKYWFDNLLECMRTISDYLGYCFIPQSLGNVDHWVCLEWLNWRNYVISINVINGAANLDETRSPVIFCRVEIAKCSTLFGVAVNFKRVSKSQKLILQKCSSPFPNCTGLIDLVNLEFSVPSGSLD